MPHESMLSATLADGTDQWDVLKLAVIGGFVVGGILLYALIDTIGRAQRTKQSELSRREIAAYVAEGSMTPETAERLLTAGLPSDWTEHVATMVQDGAIDAAGAERLLMAGPKSGVAATVGTPAKA